MICPHHFFSISPDTFCHNKVFKVHFPPTVPFLRVHFSEKPWFLSMGDGVRGQDLGTRCAHDYVGCLAFWPFQCTELGNMCVYVYKIHITDSSNSSQFPEGPFLPSPPPDLDVSSFTARALAPSDIKTFTICSIL